MLVALCACGNESVDATAKEEPVVTAVQPDTVEQAAQIADSFTSPERLIGSWSDIISPDRFINISQTDSGYLVEDNEGKYPATFEDGILRVKISDTDTVDVYLDSKSGHMLSVYQDNLSEYKRK